MPFKEKKSKHKNKFDFTPFIIFLVWLSNFKLYQFRLEDPIFIAFI